MREAMAKNPKDYRYQSAGFQDEAEWLAFCAGYGNRCLRCGEERPLTIDHVDPFGPRKDRTNIQPLCGSCNSAKSNRRQDFRGSVPIIYERRCPRCGGDVNREGWNRSFRCWRYDCYWHGDVDDCTFQRGVRP